MNDKVKLYLDGVISTICGAQAQYTENLLTNGMLISLLDKSILFTVDLSDSVDINTTAAFFHNSADPIYMYFASASEMQMRLIRKWRECEDIVNGHLKDFGVRCIFSKVDMNDDEAFTNLRNMKASEGAAFYFADNAMVPIMKGIPLLTKADKVKLTAYDTPVGHHFIHMNIYKQKLKKDYNMYFKVLDLSFMPRI